MNAAQLLNPKAFAKQSSAKPSAKANGTPLSMSPLQSSSSLSHDQQSNALDDLQSSNFLSSHSTSPHDQVDIMSSEPAMLLGDITAPPTTSEKTLNSSPIENAIMHSDNAGSRSLTDTGKARSKKSETDQEGPAKVNLPNYNPSALLNPKAAVKRANEDPTLKDIQSNHVAEDAVPDDAQDSSGVGSTSMLERVYGAGKRESQPHKRQKTNHDDEHDDKKQTNSFVGGGKGGPVSEYMKKKREEGEALSGPPSNLVDLTADDDDDLVMVGSTGPDPNREVCLGMFHTKVMAYRVPSATNKALEGLRDMWPHSKVLLRRSPAGPMVIEVIDRLNNIIGNIEPKTAGVIAPLMNGVQMHKLRLSGMLAPRKREPDERPGMPISKSLDTQVTVFAMAKYVDGIGKRLSQNMIFLYHPPNPENKEIINPHVPKTKGFVKPLATGSVIRQATSYTTRTVEEIKSDVLGVFDKLANVEDLPEMQGDETLINTELMSHQKQALCFLTKKETLTPPGEEPASPLWKEKYKKDGSKVYYNVISGDEVKRVEDSMGGIFADMMGLGKTLSLLSRVCASIEDARRAGEEPLSRDLQREGNVTRNTRGTLIVCPKSVLSNWDEQIKAHLKQNKISFYTYHGVKREQDLDELAKYDIVITSYTTVATEMTHRSSKYKALGKLNWYRIVLDEAHMIRNQTTGTFLACCALTSQRRWAVTGTPVQNKLDDLGALIRFCRISPFHDKGNFERNFIAPFKTGDAQVLDNLSLLVDSITLRRSKNKIDLPDRRDEQVRLQFSPEESELYEAFARDSNKKLQAMMGTNGLRGRGYAHMLTAITRLRLICAHGRELLSDEDMKLLDGLSYGTAIDIGDGDVEEDKPALTTSQVYGMFHLLRESNMNLCSVCSTDIGKEEEDPEYSSDDSDSEGDDNETPIGFMTPCYHIICPKCVDTFKQNLEKTKTSDNYATCPTCQQYVKPSCIPITKRGIEDEAARKEELRSQPHKTKKGGNYSGPHTKVKALIDNLTRFAAESELLPDDPPIRSVVFSGWTQYLDLS